MITFLPYSDFVQSAKVLDRQRLGKQRVECLQLLQTLNDPTSRFYNHVQTKIWIGYQDALATYSLIICKEWINRGYKDYIYDRILTYLDKKYWYIPITILQDTLGKERKLPFWLGDDRVHISHQSRLLQKDFNHYSLYFNGVDLTLKYYWPVR